MTDGSEDLATSIAREAIRDLVARYNAFGDRGRFDDLWGLFVPEAVMVVRRRPGGQDHRYEGLDAIKSIFNGVLEVGEVPDGLRPPRYLRHHTATHVIEVADGEHASGTLYFHVLSDVGLDHWGRYVDEYVRVDGRWRFCQRTVRTEGFAEWSMVGTAS